MVQTKLHPTYLAFGTITVQYTMPDDDRLLTATATCSATGSTQSGAFVALEESAADAVANTVPVGANISRYDLYNTGIKISYAPGGTVPESTALFHSHPSLHLTGDLRSLNPITGEVLVGIDPTVGSVKIGANQVSGTYKATYGTSNGKVQDPLLAVSGPTFPNAVFTRKQDEPVGVDIDIKNYTALGARRTTQKYAIAETVPTFKSVFGEMFGADMNYEVQDNTGSTWVMGNTTFGVEGLDANGNPQGAFSVNMVGIDGQNDPFEICNLRVGYDGTTYVKGLNINGAPVTIEPGTGYLIAGAPAEV
jgi:hypothetical protein